MKKYPKSVSSDYKGQLVIPKEARNELSIDGGTAFWAFAIEDEGILLKKIPMEKLSKHNLMIMELKENSKKLSIKDSNIDKSVKNYRKTKKNALEEI